MEINEDDWELINDDGFVYRCPKRPRLNSTAVPPPDPAAEAKARRERKKKLLLKLKTNYQQEINHWEHLSNTLQALQDRTQNQPPPAVPSDSDQTAFVLQNNSSDSTSKELADALLDQVEAQEATICEITRVFDVFEAFCDAEEQRLRRRFIDLPIWEPSPRELITLLLDE